MTVIVNDCGTPGQPAAEGVTVIVAVTGVVPALTVVKAGTFPLPFAPNPIEVLLFAQLYIVPATAPAKFTAAIEAPLHKNWFAGCTTFGVGLTVMVSDFGTPGQPAADGVTVIVAVTGVVPKFVAVKAGIFPLPLAPKPIDALLFVQL